LLSRGLCRVAFDLKNALTSFNGFDCSFDETGSAAKALVKAAPTSYFDCTIASEMPALASNKARGVTVWAKEAGPVVLIGIVTDGSRRRAGRLNIRYDNWT
jgi:hypothetical protein